METRSEASLDQQVQAREHEDAAHGPKAHGSFSFLEAPECFSLLQLKHQSDGQVLHESTEAISLEARREHTTILK